MNRRSFLRTSVALAAAGTSQAVQSATPSKSGASNQDAGRPDTMDPWVEIRPDHLEWNVSQITTRVGGRPILAVVKNNAYGLGLARAGQHLEKLAMISGFAVVKLDEAVSLREAGIRKPVALMGPVSEKEWEIILEYSITPMIYTEAYQQLSTLAAQRGKQISVQICVDTGIGRVGIPHFRALPFLKEVAASKHLQIDGIMMTFAEDPAFDKEQLRRFETLLAEARKSNVRWKRSHAASSFALFQNPASFLDQVRPGMAIYGVYSESKFRKTQVLDLRPVLALKARVAYVKQLRAGDSAGYNRAFKAERPVWLATIPVGHSDGWPRVATKGAKVRIGGQLYPVVGTVSASHTLVLLGEETDVSINDEAVLFDWQDGSRPEDVAKACGVSVYDLIMHLNPLLPRYDEPMG